MACNGSHREEENFVFRGHPTPLRLESDIPSSGSLPIFDKLYPCAQIYHHTKPFYLKHNSAVLPELYVAYETFGTLNEDQSNAVIVHHALTGSSHITSHEGNSTEGWWERFVGPGRPLDTSVFFVICCNNIGGCYGSSGPSSLNPSTGNPYGTTFPVIDVDDVVNSQILVLDHLNIFKVFASVGASFGGMIAQMMAALYPERIGRVISISSCIRSLPTFVALNSQQRRVIMMDPNWKGGHYYGQTFPRNGLKLSRELATIGYRSGPEWDKRFERVPISRHATPNLGPNFMVEQYTEYQGEKFCTKFDANSILYFLKAMDLFDMGEDFASIEDGVSRIKCPILVLGVRSDILLPCNQQIELADMIRKTGNNAVTFYELDSEFGHDSFLLDLTNFGTSIKGYLETSLIETGHVRKPKPTWLKE